MDFDDWVSAFTAYADAVFVAVQKDALLARLANVRAETRVPTLMNAFKVALSQRFDIQVKAGLALDEAAWVSFTEAATAIRHSGNFTFALTSTFVAPSLSTFATARDLAQHAQMGDIDTDAPPRILTMTGPTPFDLSRKQMIWVTPDDCPDDPSEIATGLGLPHFEDMFVFKFEIEGKDIALHQPTCFDAGFFEAWQFPPASSGDVGMTRDVETGERKFREFVIKAAQPLAWSTSVRRIPTSGPPTRVRAMIPDFLSGR